MAQVRRKPFKFSIKGDLYQGQQGIFFGSLSMSLLAGTCQLNWKFNWPPERQIAILERKLLRSEMSIKKNEIWAILLICMLNSHDAFESTQRVSNPPVFILKWQKVIPLCTLKYVTVLFSSIFIYKYLSYPRQNLDKQYINMSISSSFHGWFTTQYHEKCHVCLLSVTSFDPESLLFRADLQIFLFIFDKRWNSSLFCVKTGKESRCKVLNSLGRREKLNVVQLFPLYLYTFSIFARTTTDLNVRIAERVKCNVATHKVGIWTLGLFYTRCVYWYPDISSAIIIWYPGSGHYLLYIKYVTKCPIWLQSSVFWKISPTYWLSFAAFFMIFQLSRLQGSERWNMWIYEDFSKEMYQNKYIVKRKSWKTSLL